MPRHAAIRVGVPDAVPALAVNRLCGSGFQSIVNAAQVREPFLGTFKWLRFFFRNALSIYISWGNTMKNDIHSAL